MEGGRIRWVALVCGGVLALSAVAACSGSGGGSVEAFCDVYTDPKYSETDPNEDWDEFIASLKALEMAAPSDIKEHVRVQIDYYQAVGEDHRRDPYAISAAVDQVGQDRLSEASKALRIQGEECQASDVGD